MNQQQAVPHHYFHGGSSAGQNYRDFALKANGSADNSALRNDAAPSPHWGAAGVSSQGYPPHYQSIPASAAGGRQHGFPQGGGDPLQARFAQAYSGYPPSVEDIPSLYAFSGMPKTDSESSMDTVSHSRPSPHAMPFMRSKRGFQGPQEPGQRRRVAQGQQPSAPVSPVPNASPSPMPRSSPSYSEKGGIDGEAWRQDVGGPGSQMLGAMGYHFSGQGADPYGYMHAMQGDAAGQGGPSQYPIMGMAQYSQMMPQTAPYQMQMQMPFMYGGAVQSGPAMQPPGAVQAFGGYPGFPQQSPPHPGAAGAHQPSPQHPASPAPAPGHQLGQAPTPEQVHRQGTPSHPEALVGGAGDAAQAPPSASYQLFTGAAQSPISAPAAAGVVASTGASHPSMPSQPISSHTMPPEQQFLSGDVTYLKGGAGGRVPPLEDPSMGYGFDHRYFHYPGAMPGMLPPQAGAGGVEMPAGAQFPAMYALPSPDGVTPLSDEEAKALARVSIDVCLYKGQVPVRRGKAVDLIVGLEKDEIDNIVVKKGMASAEEVSRWKQAIESCNLETQPVNSKRKRENTMMQFIGVKAGERCHYRYRLLLELFGMRNSTRNRVHQLNPKQPLTREHVLNVSILNGIARWLNVDVEELTTAQVALAFWRLNKAVHQETLSNDVNSHRKSGCGHGSARVQLNEDVRDQWEKEVRDLEKELFTDEILAGFKRIQESQKSPAQSPSSGAAASKNPSTKGKAAEGKGEKGDNVSSSDSVPNDGSFEDINGAALV